MYIIVYIDVYIYIEREIRIDIRVCVCVSVYMDMIMCKVYQGLHSESCVTTCYHSPYRQISSELTPRSCPPDTWSTVLAAQLQDQIMG